MNNQRHISQRLNCCCVISKGIRIFKNFLFAQSSIFFYLLSLFPISFFSPSNFSLALSIIRTRNVLLSVVS
ncbi:Protein CBG27354 [Caenorhabditis briggsae]|uniref:Protein CBG27354 n=1 Tax=Caenorhabditis briggsae TaxID=6238 RepID=B6IGF4_CAEBR|nr:Protein CBG27354 [Caenorhabditis briggsae]CAR98984.1 Protein CBG27354 [Caenorhabditis briggsae]